MNCVRACVHSFVQGRHVITIRAPNAPPLYAAEAIRILAPPDAPEYLFDKVTSLEHLLKRTDYATTELRKCRTKQLNINQYWWGVWIDSHVPLFCAAAAAGAAAAANVFDDASLQPDQVKPPSQLYLPDRVTDLNVLQPDDKNKIHVLLSRCVRLLRSRKNAVGSRAKSPECLGLAQLCAIASVLGNYMHATFPTPDHLTTLSERIKAMQSASQLLDTHADYVFAEYIAALMPMYPFTAPPGVTWDDFVQSAIYRGNTLLRKCAHLPEPACLTAGHPQQAAPINLDDALCFDRCMLPTGYCNTYICKLCHGMSAAVVNPPRAHPTIKIPMDPYSKPGDPIYCPDCETVKLEYVQLHDIYWCQTDKVGIVVCPKCNHPTARERCPLISTLCPKCAIEKTAQKFHCYADGKRLNGTDHAMQLVVDQATGEAKYLPSCPRHAMKYIVVK